MSTHVGTIINPVNRFDYGSGAMVIVSRDGAEIMRVEPDGRLTKGAGFRDDDEASAALFEVIARCCPSAWSQAVHRAGQGDKAVAVLASVTETLRIARAEAKTAKQERDRIQHAYDEMDADFTTLKFEHAALLAQSQSPKEN